MMRKLIFVGILVLAMSGLALAQDFPKYEIFAGYSFLRSDLGNTQSSMGNYFNSDFTSGISNGHGFEGAFTYNLNKWLGIKGDFSANFGKEKMDGSYSSTYPNGEGGTYTNLTKVNGGVDMRQYTYLFGPEFSHRSKNFRPFAHVLFGFTQVDMHKIDVTETYSNSYPGNIYSDVYVYSGSLKSTSFSMAMGGGVDITINKRVSLRLPQLDYIFPMALREVHGTITEKDYYFNTVPPPTTLGTSYETYINKLRGTLDRFNNIRMSAGLVFKF
jgi:hypothetical protein